ncbi:unnamed protein product [Blepharisma stoltei]|uniref:Uncharacterized protein n=1 Tax=Blepharisma stoltei TaxID=1481888 RepID=A0AAU9JUP3_9CILI|nr:unnamed protein product [Blepharisma stoltei]
MGCCNSLKSEPHQMIMSENYDMAKCTPLQDSISKSVLHSQINFQITRIKQPQSALDESVLSSVYETDNDLPLPDITIDEINNSNIKEKRPNYLE